MPLVAPIAPLRPPPELAPATYGLLADAVVTVHFAVVLFVVVGQAAILVGALLRWGWVRNPWFRLGHLAVVLVVALQALWDVLCPLTRWENELRRAAGQPVSDATFVGRLLHGWLFVDASERTMTWIYVGFALLVLATTLLVRPRLRARPAAQS